MPEPGGQLERLKVQAFKTPDYSEQLPFDTFEAWINPNEITFSYEIEYDGGQGAGTTNSPMKFKRVKPGGLTLAFFLDGTGASGRKLDVVQEIARFQTVTGFSGEGHRTNYLKLAWGSMEVRRCVLKSASIAYKLWKPSGVPLRAVITAAFVDNSDDRTRVAREGKQSPDLTHVRTVLAGETLPVLCTRIYGDPDHYLEVARCNGLDEFRNLEPGTRLVFPPLEK